MDARHLFADLMRSQMLRPQQILDLQRRHLASMMSFAYRSLPFYRQRLAPVMEAGRGVDFERWHDVPTLDRAMVQRHFDDLTAPIVPPHAGPTAEKSTSGSSGRVLRLRRSDIVNQFDIALTQRAYTWWRIDPRASQAAIMSFGQVDPEFLRPQGQRDWHFADPSGRVYALQANVPPAEQAQFLRERQVDYLVTQPSMAEAIADGVLASKQKLKLGAILSIGETLQPDHRELFRQAFGARTFDTYGCIEAGHLAGECPACGFYHVNAETVLVEILDDRGQPVGPGETGRAVLTSLHNFAMPLIRYDIGDLITRAPRGNRCKRGLPSISAIGGRETELFVTREGEKYFPSVIARDVAQYIDLTEIQFVQTDYELVEVRYVPGAGRVANRLAEAESFISSKIGHDIKVKIVAVAELPRLRGAKQIMKLSLVPRPARQ